MTLDVAFVCTGNRYRSALAEAAFRSAVEGLPVRVESFGTLDVGDAGPLPEALEAAREHGLDLSRHAARPVGGADLSEAWLVLGFEAAHLDAASAAGAPPERTFTLPELIELLDRVDDVPETDPVRRAVELVRRADALRDSAGAPREITDPIGRSRSQQAKIGRQVYAAATRAAERLFGRARAGAESVTAGAG